jgi:hypothetical protein
MACVALIGLVMTEHPTTTTLTPMSTQRTTLSKIYKSSAYPVTVTRQRQLMFQRFQRAVEYVRDRWVLERLKAGRSRLGRFHGAHDPRWSK